MNFPHTVNVFPPQAVIGGDGVRDSSAFPASVEILCQIAPMSSEELYREFGTDSKRAFEVFTSKLNATYIQQGAKATWNGYDLRVVADAMTYEGFRASRVEHCRFVLEVVR